MIDKITKYETKLRYKGSNETINFTQGNNGVWIVTDFAYNTNNEMIFVVQLLEKGCFGEGFSGLNCYVFTREELEDNFNIIGLED